VLILSRAKITIRAAGDVRVEGLWQPYATRIADFIAEMGLAHGVVRFRNGRCVFSADIDDAMRQRIRNYLTNLCPLKNLDR